MMVQLTPRVTCTFNSGPHDELEVAFRDLTAAVGGGLRSSSSILKLAQRVQQLQIKRGFDPHAPRTFGQPEQVDFAVTALIIRVTESLINYSPQNFSFRSVIGGFEVEFTLEDVSTFALQFNQEFSGKMHIKIEMKTNETSCRVTFGKNLALDYFKQGWTIYSRAETVVNGVRILPAKDDLVQKVKYLLGL